MATRWCLIRRPARARLVALNKQHDCGSSRLLAISLACMLAARAGGSRASPSTPSARLLHFKPTSNACNVQHFDSTWRQAARTEGRGQSGFALHPRCMVHIAVGARPYSAGTKVEHDRAQRARSALKGRRTQRANRGRVACLAAPIN